MSDENMEMNYDYAEENTAVDQPVVEAEPQTEAAEQASSQPKKRPAKKRQPSMDDLTEKTSVTYSLPEELIRAVKIYRTLATLPSDGAKSDADIIAKILYQDKNIKAMLETVRRTYAAMNRLEYPEA